VRRTFRWLNVAVAVVTLASALAVLWNDLSVVGYQACYRDALWFVVAYAALQAWLLVVFARDDRLVPWIAIGKAVAAYVFLLSLGVLWPRWRVWTPARYVYEVFAFGSASNLGLFTLIFLGRGAFNTVGAFVLTADWWRPLRHRRPLLGRLVTAVPIGLTVLCVWLWSQLVREEAHTVSPEAQEIAAYVYETLDCDAVRAKDGQTTTDLRQRGERKYGVRITYGCALTSVVVHTEEGTLGSTSGAKLSCSQGKPTP
jgi:hypothetical protein